MKNRMKISITIISIIIVIMFGFLYAIHLAENVKEDDVITLSATVDKIQHFKAGNDSNLGIMCDEYSNLFILPANIYRQFSFCTTDDLQSGDKISLKINHSSEKDLNNFFVVTVVAIETEEKKILSLEEYNKYMRQAQRPVKILICTIIAVLSVLLVVGIKKKDWINQGTVSVKTQAEDK